MKERGFRWHLANTLLEQTTITVTHSRRWTDFEDYLIPRATWAKEREQHHAKLGLPLQGEQYLVQLRAQLAAVTAEVDRRVPGNPALTIDAQKGEFHLAAQKGTDKPDEVKTLKELIESRLPRTELVDVLTEWHLRMRRVTIYAATAYLSLSPPRCWLKLSLLRRPCLRRKARINSTPIINYAGL